MRCADCHREASPLHRNMCGACYRRWRKENLPPNTQCEYCSRSFFNPSRHRHSLCSRECFRLWKINRSSRNELIPNRPLVQVDDGGMVCLVCETCGGSFLVRPYELKRRPRFCSSRCWAATRVSPRAILQCHHCGGIFRYLPNRLLHAAGRYCSRACFEEARQLARLFPEGSRSRAYRKFRNRLVEQAGVCNRCGAGHDLVLHHRERSRERPELLFAIDNVEVLCRSCHTGIHGRQRHFRLPEVE